MQRHSLEYTEKRRGCRIGREWWTLLVCGYTWNTFLRFPEITRESGLVFRDLDFLQKYKRVNTVTISSF